MQPDADPVADGVLGDLGADLGDDAGDLVAGDHRVGDLAPLAADGVDVGVADPAELDVDQHVARPDLTALDGQRVQGVRGGGGTVGACGRAHWLLQDRRRTAGAVLPLADRRQARMSRDGDTREGHPPGCPSVRPNAYTVSGRWMRAAPEFLSTRRAQLERAEAGTSGRGGSRGFAVRRSLSWPAAAHRTPAGLAGASEGVLEALVRLAAARTFARTGSPCWAPFATASCCIERGYMQGVSVSSIPVSRRSAGLFIPRSKVRSLHGPLAAMACFKPCTTSDPLSASPARPLGDRT